MANDVKEVVKASQKDLNAFLKNQADLLKLDTSDKAAKTGTFLISTILIVFMIGMALAFFMVLLELLLAEWLGSHILALFFAGISCLVLGLFIFLTRSFIRNVLLNKITNLVDFKSVRNAKDLDLEKHKVKLSLDYSKQRLGDQAKNLKSAASPMNLLSYGFSQMGIGKDDGPDVSKMFKSSSKDGKWTKIFNFLSEIAFSIFNFLNKK